MVFVIIENFPYAQAEIIYMDEMAPNKDSQLWACPSRNCPPALCDHQFLIL